MADVFETTLALSRLYRTGAAGSKAKARLFINSGTVSVYGSDSATQPASLAAMTLNTENTGVSGIVKFDVVPKYIAIVQESGTTTELVSYGLNAVNLAAIS